MGFWVLDGIRQQLIIVVLEVKRPKAPVGIDETYRQEDQRLVDPAVIGRMSVQRFVLK